jgi:hypothetical protein
MKLSTLNELKTSRDMIDVFRGYNHNLRIGDGEFYDMTNLSSDNYPVLSPRPQRGVYAEPDAPQGMIAKDSLCYVDGSDFIINGYPVQMGLSTAAEYCPKTLIPMGAYVIIMPDKKYINTADLTDFGDIEATVTTSSNVSFSLCKIDGAECEAEVGATAPQTPANMDLWVDTSSEPHALKQYSASNDMWSPIATTYIKISAVGIGKPFEVNDGVTISGIEVDSLSDLNNTMVIWAKGDDYIVVTGMLDVTATQETAITVKRQMPNMDFIIESGNRLWGCRYGTAVNGAVVNEIYASKLGDFKNWNCFAGISTDSYAATVGTDGQFTGAITHLGYPLFFKENCMHKVYGNFPANFRIQDTACRGVQKGCSKSLAIVNEVLYYKSRSAICAYDGSLPAEISSALGENSYHNAVAGVLGNKYYVSMSDESEAHHLFVYDAMKGTWHREDNTRATSFCNCRGDLYYIDLADNKIRSVRGSGEPETAPIKWEAVTGVIGTDSPDKKYVSRIDVRMLLKVGTNVTFYAEYDSLGVWETLFTMVGTSLSSFAVPIRPKRCDHLRLKIVGSGDAKIYSICKTVEQGSDI